MTDGSIYDIDRRIAELFTTDEETGEVMFDEETYSNLQIERTAKIESTALLHKEVEARIAAIKEYKKGLDARIADYETVLKRLENLVRYATNGEKFETEKVTVNFKKSRPRVDILVPNKDFVAWCELSGMTNLVNYTTSGVPNKTAIKEYLSDGEKSLGGLATYVEDGITMSIK